MLAIAAICIDATDTRASETQQGWHNGMPFIYEDGLLNYLGLPREHWSENGVDLYFSTLVIGQSIVDGGTEEEEEITASYDLQLYLDTASMSWWDNGYALVRAEGKTDSSGVNPYTGAIIPVNFDAMVPVADGTGFELTEWWYAHQFSEGKLELLGGMWDIGRFYDLSPFSGPYPYRFLNSHMFFNSVLLPYAPYNILGAMAIYKPNPGITVTTSINDPNSSATDVDWFGEGDFDVMHEWRFMAKPFGKLAMFLSLIHI